MSETEELRAEIDRIRLALETLRAKARDCTEWVEANNVDLMKSIASGASAPPFSAIEYWQARVADARGWEEWLNKHVFAVTDWRPVTTFGAQVDCPLPLPHRTRPHDRATN